MDSLFAEYEPKRFEPLAVRLRPTSLDHFYGQEKAVGKGSFLRAMIERIRFRHYYFMDLLAQGKRP